MSDSVFNPETFLGTQTEDAGSTSYFPVPIGEYAQAQVKRVDARQFTSNDSGQKFTILELQWVILDDEVRRVTEQEEPIARQTLFLDLTPGGGLDFGRNKNVPLSRVREAFGQNKSGRGWTPSHFVGQVARVQVVHEADRRTGEPRAIVARVVGV